MIHLHKVYISLLIFQVDKLASGFLALGLKKGDRVGMWGPNVEEWILTQFATAKAGLILVCINIRFNLISVLFVSIQLWFESFDHIVLANVHMYVLGL